MNTQNTQECKVKSDLMDCPGAWYGWQPKRGDFSGCGHIVIDPKDTLLALQWLKRRYWVSPRNTTTDGGLMIDLQLRPVKPYRTPNQLIKPEESL